MRRYKWQKGLISSIPDELEKKLKKAQEVLKKMGEPKVKVMIKDWNELKKEMEKLGGRYYDQGNL